MKCAWGKLGLFAGGLLFGTAGLKILSSKEAKKAYTYTTAAALRAKEEVMTVVTAVKENAGDILADAGLRRRLGTGYDIVLANIVADVIIPLAALAPAFLTPGGTFVCSGIIAGREDEVAAALTRAGFTVTAHDTLEEWHCFTAVLA